VAARARTVRLTLAYDGTEFAGWQRQPDAPTVQDAVARACERILGAPAKVTGASRTDAGVHALGQVASLTTESPIALSALARGLNALLPPEIRVRDVREAPAGFDARRSAAGKRYAYLIDAGAAADPFLRRYAWHVPVALDPGRMAAGLAHLRGRRDFSALCASPGRGRNPVCTIRSARLVVRRHRLLFVISGDSFLHHMVRNAVGSLVEVGRGVRSPEWIAEVLAGRDRTRAGPTAPARGLFLVRVLYPRAAGPAAGEAGGS